MQVISTSEARKRFSEIVNQVRYSNTPILIGRHNEAEVLMIKFPNLRNDALDAITNMNQYGESFDFLQHEPDLYSSHDLKKRYV